MSSGKPDGDSCCSGYCSVHPQRHAHVKTERDGLLSERQVRTYYGSVTITGMVELVSSFGAFLVVNGRRVFVPLGCTTDSLGTFEKGETVTLQVAWWYAKQKGSSGKPRRRRGDNSPHRAPRRPSSR
jgi:hypothetical protein